MKVLPQAEAKKNWRISCSSLVLRLRQRCQFQLFFSHLHFDTLLSEKKSQPQILVCEIFNVY